MLPDSESSKSQELLEKFSLHETNGVYVLGCTAAALYIHAQQMRAFNLVWALKKEGKIPDDCEVAVVGGGIAGLTAAVALAASKVKVKVFERTHRALSFQRGNLTRFVHPNVARWPDENSGYPITHLPFMNWRAGIVGTVNAEIEAQWKIAKDFFAKDKQLELIEEADVTAVEWDEAQQLVLLTINGEVKPYRCVILAVGYGIEISDHGISSYWHNDDFAQPVLGPEKQKKYLVSGIGDGALTEILRLKLADFQHHKFIESVIFESKLKEAGRLAKNDDWSGWSKNGNELKKEFAQFFYEKPEELKDSKIRLDTKVVLIGGEEQPHIDRGPTKNSAQILHRLCVKLLYDAGELEYKKGRLEDLKEEYINNGYSIVERHGSQKAIIPLLKFKDEKDSRYLALVNKARSDDDSEPRTWFPNFGKGFLSNELMGCHFEKKYEIGIQLTGNETIDNSQLNYIFEKLKVSDKKTISRTADTSFTCAEGDFWLRLQPLPTILYSVPQNAALLTRYHVPAEFPNGVLLKTTEKRLLDLLFDDEKLPYHLYRVYLADNFPKDDPDFELDQFVNTDTRVYLLDQKGKERFIEIICAEGMHQAHQILRVPLLIEVMGNKWPTKSVHGLGWAVQNTSKTNLESQRGNELLQRSI